MTEHLDAGVGTDEEIRQGDGLSAPATSVVKEALSGQERGLARYGPVFEYIGTENRFNFLDTLEPDGQNRVDHDHQGIRAVGGDEDLAVAEQDGWQWEEDGGQGSFHGIGGLSVNGLDQEWFAGFTISGRAADSSAELCRKPCR